MAETIICTNENELSSIAISVLEQYPDDRIFIFKGDLGAGKTTFIKAFCKSLQIVESTNSPSFAIINEYLTKDGNTVYHFDFYRIQNISEAYDIGYEEYFYSGSYCFIEWPELIQEILPEQYIEVKIHWDLEKNAREISITKNFV